jgi:hypothetical protein
MCSDGQDYFKDLIVPGKHVEFSAEEAGAFAVARGGATRAFVSKDIFDDGVQLADGEVVSANELMRKLRKIGVRQARVVDQGLVDTLSAGNYQDISLSPMPYGLSSRLIDGSYPGNVLIESGAFLSGVDGASAQDVKASLHLNGYRSATLVPDGALYEAVLLRNGSDRHVFNL